MSSAASSSVRRRGPPSPSASSRDAGRLTSSAAGSEPRTRSSSSSSSGSRGGRYIAISYAIEWLFFLCVIIIPLYIAVYHIPFRVRSVSLTDSTLAQPYVAKDSLPILFVFETSIIVPLIFFHLYPFLLSKFYWKAGLPKHEYSFKYSYWWSVCIIHTVGLTVLLSELSKRLVQAPRPDFMWRCFPSGVPDDVREKAERSFWMFHTDLCTPKDRDFLEDGMQSFPSEHTSLAWCMCSVLILFFATIHKELLLYSTPLVETKGGRHGRGHLARSPPPQAVPSIAAIEVKAQPPNMIGGAETETAVGQGQGQGQAHSQTDSSHPLLDSAASSLPQVAQPAPPPHTGSASFWPTSHVLFIAHIILPFGWAVAVGFSRTFDHRHHVQDVLAGAMLGVGVAYAVYKVHLAKFTGYHQRWQAQAEEENAHK